MTRRRESGIALIIALAALLVVAAAGTALCLRTSDTARANVAAREKLAARYAAEAGVERARWALLGDVMYEGETIRFDAFDVAVRVTPAPEGRRDVRSVASSPAAHAAVDARLRLTSGLPHAESWRDE